MRRLTHLLSNHVGETDAVLKLPFELRQRSRLRAQLDTGEDVGIMLERGAWLRDGDRLGDPTGYVVSIAAASETVSTVYSTDPQTLARVAYHLGNRHVHVQVGENWLRYLHDHVLDHLVEQQGLTVVVEDAPFEPEPGAYHGHHSHD